ncbi:MAG: hypothetical protein ACR2NN_18260 [Bryobacteraceae bacterium]
MRAKPAHYSCRGATAGSTRAARQAGAAQAISATSANTAEFARSLANRKRQNAEDSNRREY